MRMNAYQLREMVKARLPGYDDNEYLREVNDAYRKVVEEITLLSDDFFTDVRVLTVSTQATDFDLNNNVFQNYSGGLTAAINGAQGPLFGTAGASEADSSSPAAAVWTNPGNIKKTDQTYATAALNAGNGRITQWLTIRGLAFNIPSNAIITGIQATLIAHANVSGAVSISLEASQVSGDERLPSAGQIGVGSALFTGADISVTYGGPNAVTGISNGILNAVPPFTPSVVNSSTFGAALQFSNTSDVTMSVDSLTVTVFYTFSVNAGIHPLLYQIKRIRVRQPNDNNWYEARPRDANSDDYLQQQQDSTQQPQNAPPYIYFINNKNTLSFGRPLIVGVLVEVTYIYAVFDLNILSGGTIASNLQATSPGNVIGNGTVFTTILPPVLQPFLPVPNSSHPNLDLVSEIGFGAAPANFYAVTQYNSDTLLICQGFAVVEQPLTLYFLSNVPEIPYPHHRVIADLATAQMLSTPGSDAERFAQWQAIAERGIERMKDAMQARQKQESAKKNRFPFGTRHGRGVI